MHAKRKNGEDSLQHLDARDLLSRFRSKKDLYQYLDQHRKSFVPALIHDVVQMYLPGIERINKDFLRDVFSGKKHLIPRA